MMLFNFKVTGKPSLLSQRITFIPHHHGFSHSGLYPVCQPETGFTQLNGCRCQIQCKNTVGCSNFGFYPATGLDYFGANMLFVPSCVHVLFFCAFFWFGSGATETRFMIVEVLQPSSCPFPKTSETQVEITLFVPHIS